MSFDAWVVAFGLSRLLRELALVPSNAAYLVMVVVGVIDVWLLYRFFSNPHLEASLHVDPSPSPGSS
jgi:hypothetical protein